MQLVTDGPDIPEEILEAHETGDLVFFCGAGVSVPSGLPLFKGLVEKVYDQLNENPDELESQELEAENYDRVLGLLETRLVAGLVRKTIIGLLKVDPNSDLSTHQSLLELSSGQDGKTRLITTNFDNAFVQVGPRGLRRYDAPNLPSPKKYRWDGIVHIHGRIREGDDPEGEDLILTGADFGRAYLTERWASIFLTELFRGFTVVFVGYSVSDPVVRYIIDALAADKARGETVREPFVLDGYRTGEEERAAREWKARGLTAILFPSTEGYRLLYDTLRAWAGMYRDGLIGGKENVVRNFAHKMPRELHRHEVSQLLRSIKEPTGHVARKFCQVDPPAPIQWLEEFEKEGLLSLPPSIEDLNTPAPSAGDDCRAEPGRPLSPVCTALVRWLAKHLNKDETLGWAVKRGGLLHPETRSAVRRGLDEDGSALPEAKRQLWKIMASEAWSCSVESGTRSFGLLDRLKKRGWDAELRQEFVRLLGPCFEIRTPYSMFEERETENIRSHAEVGLTLTLGSHTNWVHEELRKIPGWDHSCPN